MATRRRRVSVFLTGFPGFLGSALVDRLLDRTDRVDCLVQSAHRDEAERRAAEIAGTDWADRIRLHEGDLTDARVGLADDRYERLADDADEVFHLAAVYDLGVERELARRVNVEGTERVLDFTERADARLQYVSTCYVSGRYGGVFDEAMLREGQSFTNHYEETKYLAEVAVRDRMADGLAATVYRPAITVGDSRTGETQKYDGPYYLIRFLLRQPRLAVFPRLRGATTTELNVVPRDYVVDAIDALSRTDRAVGTTYNLCDPHPPTVADVRSILAAATDRRVLSVPTSQSLLTRVLSVERVRRWTGVDPAVVPYFTHPTRYVCPNARRDLAGTGVSPPAFGAYARTLVEYVRDHPDVPSDAMV
ncbi:SDR family oxidoreductase [Halogeometricum limi]|uniref:Thioester reductase domain-containing protein n=1 Tax=Halogeometricum limi TaxID=555875 RepID=A0A1I6HKL6_9EURY|nr:SDR family oxidoreductase [Halogeometricum limi]SFR54840.1 Thioester reductase domain-containing protein [Halogeometricum limi]